MNKCMHTLEQQRRNEPPAPLTLIPAMRGEDALRIEDFHYFINSKKVSSNPKAILWSPHRLSDVLNLWTRLEDQNYERSRA